MVNVGRVIASKRLGAQIIRVTRRSGGWVKGEFVPTGKEELEGVHAIVTVAQPKDLVLIPEGDRVTGALKVLTHDRLLQTRDDGLGDIVTYHGTRYKVSTVSDDSYYGFYRSVCTRLEDEADAE